MHKILLLICGAIIGRGMIHTPITEQNAWISFVVMILWWLLLSIYLLHRYGWQVGKWLLVLALFGVVIEYVWITTCVPYWCFEYTPLIGPRFFWTFPFSLLVIRPLLVVSILQFLPTKNFRLSFFLWWLLLMMLDLFLDPVAVHQWLWIYTWASSFSRFGIPRTNYLGRLFTGWISSVVFLHWCTALRGDNILKMLWYLFVSMYVTWFLLIVL